MRNWKYNLRLNFYYDDSISIEDKGHMIAKRILRLPLDKMEYYCGDDFEELAEKFNDICAYDDVSILQDFNYSVEELYNMADRYDIWVNTYEM